MSDLCIECRESVSGRKYAVTCDACERWQHVCATRVILFFVFFKLFDICFSQSFVRTRFCGTPMYKHVDEQESVKKL